MLYKIFVYLFNIADEKMLQLGTSVEDYNK